MSSNKKNKICGSRCQEHIFYLKPLIPDTYYKDLAYLQLCPKNNTLMINLFRQSLQKLNIYPQFNNDGNSYTPAFILQVDKDQYIQNNDRYLSDHKKKIRQQVESKYQIFVPKPSRKNKYCGVCHQHYEEYLDHTKNPNHIKNIISNKYHKFVVQIAKKQFFNQPLNEIILIDDKQQIPSSTYAQGKMSQINQHQPPLIKKKKNIENYEMNQVYNYPCYPIPQVNFNIPSYFKMATQFYTQNYQQLMGPNFYNNLIPIQNAFYYTNNLNNYINYLDMIQMTKNTNKGDKTNPIILQQ